MKVRVFDAPRYTAARGPLLRFVAARGWPGHQADDVFRATGPELPASASNTNIAGLGRSGGSRSPACSARR